MPNEQTLPTPLLFNTYHTVTAAEAGNAGANVVLVQGPAWLISINAQDQTGVCHWEFVINRKGGDVNTAQTLSSARQRGVSSDVVWTGLQPVPKGWEVTAKATFADEDDVLLIHGACLGAFYNVASYPSTGDTHGAIVNVSPAGDQIVRTGAGIAGNVVTNLSPGVGKRWFLLGGIIDVDSDANAANRYVDVYITDGTNLMRFLGRLNVVIANQTGELNINAGDTFANVTVDTGNSRTVIGHANMGLQMLQGSDEFRIVVTNGLAGDAYNYTLRFLEVPL